MEKELVFTLSQERYSELPAYIQELHDRGMRFVTIIVSDTIASASWSNTKIETFGFD
jgi:hypothetical protein